MRAESGRKKDKVTWGDVFPKYRISMLDNGRIKRVRIEGAKKLLLCIDKEVKISLGEETLHMHGEGLACFNYSSGAVEVSGEMREILFERTVRNEERRR